MPASKELFVALEPNKSIENYDPHRQANLARGAFSDEAREALAIAVKVKATGVNMDGRRMAITYHKEHVYVVAIDGGLPCGTFSYSTLRQRPWRNKA